MRVRTAVVAALAVAVAVSGEANASPHKAKAKPKPKPVCNVITDPAGDSPFDPLGTQSSKMPQDANGDILSADLASNAKYLTAVIRVKSLASPDTTFPEAHFYMVSWTVPGHSSPVYLGATVDPNPASAAYGPQYVFGDGGTVSAKGIGLVSYYNIASAAVRGKVDTAKKTITLSVPISALSSYGKFTPGNKFTGLEASSQALINGPVLPTNVPAVGGSIAWGWQEDVADVSKDYTAGTPSCVTPGA